MLVIPKVSIQHNRLISTLELFYFELRAMTLKLISFKNKLLITYLRSNRGFNHFPPFYSYATKLRTIASEMISFHLKNTWHWQLGHHTACKFQITFTTYIATN